MKRRLTFLALLVCSSAAWADESYDNETKTQSRIVPEDRVEKGPLVTLPADRPVLRWEVVRVPGSGVVENLSGAVMKLLPDKGWVYVEIGESLPTTSKLLIHPGASMSVRFSASEFIEFNAAPKDRWVVFDVL